MPGRLRPSKSTGFRDFACNSTSVTLADVAEFVVEFYVSRADTDAVGRGAESVRIAAGELTREGTPVRYPRSIFLPEDETCFFLLVAGSVSAVRETVRRAALPFDRVTETIAEPHSPAATESRAQAAPCTSERKETT